MIINPEKFQAMIMSCDKKENKYDLDINNNSVISSEKHVSSICRKANRQLQKVKIRGILVKKRKKLL